VRGAFFLLSGEQRMLQCTTTVHRRRLDGAKGNAQADSAPGSRPTSDAQLLEFLADASVRLAQRAIGTLIAL